MQKSKSKASLWRTGMRRTAGFHWTNKELGASPAMRSQILRALAQGSTPTRAKRSRGRVQKPVAKRAITTMMATCMVPCTATTRT